MSEKLGEYAYDRPQAKWHQRWKLGAVILTSAAALWAFFSADLKDWLMEGELTAQIEHASGLVPGSNGPEREIGQFTIKFLNHSNDTIVVNELKFPIEADGVPAELLGSSNAIVSDGWVKNGIHLPNLSPGQKASRSDHCDLTLKPGESGNLEKTLYPPLIADALTKGVYRVRTVVVHTDGEMELPPENLNIGRTVLNTNRLPTQLYRKTEDGFEAIGPSAY